MDAFLKPGFGWTSNSKSHKVVIYEKTVFIDESYLLSFKCDDKAKSNILSSHIPAEFMNNELQSIGYQIEPNLFTLALKQSVELFFNNNNILSEDLNEFYQTTKSNNRMLRWNIMDISPNTSFKLHAHQNIEVIFVIKGSIHELRLVNSYPSMKKVYGIDETTGPDLSGRASQLLFQHRCTSAVDIHSLPPPPSSSSSCQFSTNLIEEYQRSFLINERGSIHLSYTSDDGALLLVLWSGGHGNIPLDQYPDDASESLRLPPQVIPAS